MNIEQVIQLVNNEGITYEGDLRHYFRVIWQSENVDVPYHNLRHMLHVLWHTHRGLVSTGISPIEIRKTLIAAIFHDYNHPGKLGNDADNIEIAVQGLRNNILPEDAVHMEDIVTCIKATQFPHIQGEFPINAKILRDVDVASTLNNVWMQTVLFGLGKEFGKTPNEMLKMQLVFLPLLKFETIWAQKEYGPLVKKRIKEVQKMIDCLSI